MSLLELNASRLGMSHTEAVEGGFLDHEGRALPAHPATERGTTTMITPVTPNLAAAMNRTSAVLDAIESRTKKMNDRDAYPELANQLEDLTVNLLSASSSLSLIGVRPMGARFDFAPDTKLAAVAAECVSYLRNDATKLLRAKSFSVYETTHTDNVLPRIKGLYGLLRTAILHQVTEDLKTLSDLSPARLVAVAASVSEAVEMDGKASKNPS